MTGLRPRTLTEYAGLLWRKKLFILLITAVVLLATWIVIKRVPDIYEARALLVVVGLRGDEGGLTVATEISLITKQLESRTMLESLIRQHDLYQGLSREAQVGQMLKALKLETRMRGYSPDLPEAVAISFRYPDAAVTQRVLNDVVLLFTGTNELIGRQTAEEARTIETKIAKMEGQLRQQRVQRRTSSPTIDPRTVRAERLAAAATVESLKDRQFAFKRQIEDQQREIAEQQKLVKSAPPAKENGAQGVLLVRKAELDGQLKDYATQYTDKNPKVVQARSQQQEVNRQLEQLNASAEGAEGQAATAEARELRALQRDLSRLQTELEVTERELNRRSESLMEMPVVGPSTTMTAVPVDGGGRPGMAEMNYLQNRYVSLLDKHDRMQMDLSAPIERGLAPFRLIDPPNLPIAPTGPNRTKLKLFALALALASGLGAAAIIEGPRLRMIQDERDAEYFLGVPVVGFIPETLTPDERGHQRRLLLTRRIVLLGLAVVAVPLLVILIYQSGVIQQIAFR